MAMTFSSAKLLFYTQLRQNKLVQAMGAENKIRDLVETLTIYADCVNQANFSFQKQKKKEMRKTAENCRGIIDKINTNAPETVRRPFEKFIECAEALVDRRARPIVLDFSDVQTIAYAVGTYKDERHWLQRVFTTENPLDSIVKKYEQHYEEFKRTGTLTLNYFDTDVIPDILIAANTEMQMDLRAKSLVEMFKKCCNYVNRQVWLLQLADQRNAITGNSNERISKKHANEIAGYFQKQAMIDGLLFRTLHFVCLKLRGDPEPLEATEKTYKEFMDSYQQDGAIDAQYVPKQTQEAAPSESPVLS